MHSGINFKCIEAIMKALKKEFPALCCYTHGYSDSMEENYFKYYDKSKFNRYNYIRALVYKGGFCNDYDYVNKCYFLNDEVTLNYSFKNESDMKRAWEIIKEIVNKDGYSFDEGWYTDGDARIYIDLTF